LSLLAFHLKKTPVQGEEPTRVRLNRHAPIAPYQNSGPGLFDCLADLSEHPAPHLLRHSLEVPFKRGEGKLDRRGLTDAIHDVGLAAGKETPPEPATEQQMWCELVRATAHKWREPVTCCCGLLIWFSSLGEVSLRQGVRSLTAA